MKKHEPKIKVGDPDGKEWRDVEADEVDVGKELIEDSSSPHHGKVAWRQWAGIVERGRPSSLVLFQTNPKPTTVRAPWPGPIKKKDWEPAAERWLKGRNVVLHTDGARSYKIGINRKDFIDGVIHDYVVHKFKKQANGMKQRAKYVQLFSHKIDGRFLYTKGGVQLIDRCWGHVRSHIGRRAIGSCSTKKFSDRVRAAQWTYWNMGEDLFLKTGELIRYT